jgi:WD40 repeat protein
MKCITLWIEKFLVALLLLTSCAPSPKYSFPPNEYSKGYLPLESQDASKVEEIGSWKVMGEDISLLKYKLRSNQVISVNEQKKKVVILTINTKQIDIHSILNVPDLRIVGIDAKGEKLFGAMWSKNLNSGEESPEYLQWIATWDPGTGLQIDCIMDPCAKPDQYESTKLGASIDYNGETVVAFGDDSYILWQLSSAYSSVGGENDPDADYWWHIGKIAIDSPGNRVAVVYQEGRITLEPIVTHWPLIHITELQKGIQNELEPIKFALFDQNGKWLAIVRGNQLSIWNIGNWAKKIVYQEEVGVIHGLSFDSSGTLLFLATEDKIRVIGLAKKKLETEFNAPGISSLDISEDNRLLFWGDETGTVHAWGIPSTQK